MYWHRDRRQEARLQVRFRSGSMLKTWDLPQGHVRTSGHEAVPAGRDIYRATLQWWPNLALVLARNGEIIERMDARIKKTDDGDYYHLVIHGEFTHINEEVDGPKLLAILSKEKLIGMTLADVLSLLDVANPGYEMAVGLQERKLG